MQFLFIPYLMCWNQAVTTVSDYRVVIAAAKFEVIGFDVTLIEYNVEKKNKKTKNKNEIKYETI